MGLMEELLEGNARFTSTGFNPQEAFLDAPPAKRLAVVACMDARHIVEHVLGLTHGDAVILRNAGNVVDDGTLRSLIVAIHLLGVRSVVVMGHTRCGMTTVGQGEFRIAHSIAETTKVALHDVMRPDFQRWLGGFSDVHNHVWRSLQLVRGHPYLPDDIEVFGLVYDNQTGRVSPVESRSGPHPKGGAIGKDDAPSMKATDP